MILYTFGYLIAERMVNTKFNKECYDITTQPWPLRY